MKDAIELNTDELVEEGLKRLLDDYLTQKQNSLMQLRRGTLSREGFLREAAEHLHRYDPQEEGLEEQIIESFEQYIFGYFWCTIWNCYNDFL